MIRRTFRIGLRVGILAAIAAAVVRLTQGRRAGPPPAWSPEPWTPPAPPVTPPPEPPREATPDAPTAPQTGAPAPARVTAWVQPSGGVCPPTHPVKAKDSSKLFHLPGMAAYNRTNPDRCYSDEGVATKDGYTKAKR